MAWFRNHYHCYRCDLEWRDEWSCQCDDDCPACGARHVSVAESDDMTTVVEEEDRSFVVLFSPRAAGHEPDYVEVRRFLTSDFAETFAKVYEPGKFG